MRSHHCSAGEPNIVCESSLIAQGWLLQPSHLPLWLIRDQSRQGRRLFFWLFFVTPTSSRSIEQQKKKATEVTSFLSSPSGQIFFCSNSGERSRHAVHSRRKLLPHAYGVRDQQSTTCRLYATEAHFESDIQIARTQSRCVINGQSAYLHKPC